MKQCCFLLQSFFLDPRVTLWVILDHILIAQYDMLGANRIRSSSASRHGTSCQDYRHLAQRYLRHTAGNCMALWTTAFISATADDMRDVHRQVQRNE